MSEASRQWQVEHIGEISREDLIADFTRRIMAAPTGTLFELIQHAEGGMRRASVPYGSPEARALAGQALDRGREAAAGGASVATVAAPATPIDELLFNVGGSREMLQRALDAAHAAIPEDLAPRKDATQGDPVYALAQRIETALARCTGISNVTEVQDAQG